MKKLAVLLITIGGLLSGCVAYEDTYRERTPYRGDRDRDYRGDRDRDGVPNRVDRDRDGDGVRNRQDAYPNDPRRY
jgi:hypothetical protein